VIDVPSKHFFLTGKLTSSSGFRIEQPPAITIPICHPHRGFPDIRGYPPAFVMLLPAQDFHPPTMSASHLLKLQLGPVQDFIAATLQQ
jgi:hypothetical protein